MINRQVRIWRGCQTALVLPLALLSWGAPAADDNYVPPVSLDSVESLMEQPRDNGYGIGSLIAAQQANDGAASSPSTAGMTKGDLTGGTRASGEPRTAAAREARRAAEARREVKTLSVRLAQLQDDKKAQEKQLAVLHDQVTSLSKQLKTAQAAVKAAAVRGDSDAEVDRLRKQLAAQDAALAAVQGKLAEAQSEATDLKARPVGPKAQLTSASGKQDYVVGQSIASSLRERLDSYAATGVTLSRDGVLAGINDGLAGSMQLTRAEMDRVYREFATRLQSRVAGKVKAAEQQLAAAVKGKKVAKTVDGMRYVVVKKGRAIADPDAPVSLALTERTADDGRVLSRVPRLTLSPADDMPPVVREALPLLGVDAEVKVWALARSVYGSLPLPKGVEPYTLLTYDMTGLAVGAVSPAAGEKRRRR